MTFYLVTGASAPTDPVDPAEHLPSRRRRCYPSGHDRRRMALVAPLIPIGRPGRRGGRPATHSRRDIVDAIRYVTHNGGSGGPCPPTSHHGRPCTTTTCAGFANGTVNRVHNTLREQARAVAGRTETPTAAIADSQSVRAAETVARASRGYNAGKNVNSRKRHIVVDTAGLLLVVLVTAASVQDRHAARTLLHALRMAFPTVAKVWVDGDYSGRLVDWATTTLRICVEVVTKLAGQVGVHVLPKRWVVERAPAWITRSRRTVRDYERRRPTTPPSSNGQ
jgi:transposase